MRYLGPTGTSIAAAIRDLNSASARARVVAAEALTRAGPAGREEAARALREKLDDSSPDVRYAVALALGRLGDREALPTLCDMLQDPEPMPRQAAAVALGELGDPRGFPALVRALRSAESELRYQAVTAISLVDPGAAVAPLLQALGDEDGGVRGSAAAALGDLADSAARDPLARLAHGDPEQQVRLEAALALARLGDRRGTPVLVAALDDKDYGLLAAEHLFRCPDPEATGALEAILDRWLKPALIKVWAAGALVRLGHDEARAQLVGLLDSRKAPVRGLTIQVLGRIGQPWSRKTLKALAEQPETAGWGPRREEILEALSSDGGPSGGIP